MMIERIADAMAADDVSEHMFYKGDNKAGWQQLARAALTAMLEPTPGVRDAIYNELCSDRHSPDPDVPWEVYQAPFIWKAAIQAALQGEGR